MKKIICVLTSAAMLFSVLTAFAEQVNSGTSYWRQTYEGLSEYAVPEESSLYINGAAEAASEDEVAALAGNGVFIGGKTGVYGKADTAFAVENADVKYVSEVTTAKISSGQEAVSAAALFGFDMAVADANSDRQINMACTRNSSKNGAVEITRAIKFENGRLTAVFGKTLDTAYTLPELEWVRFDFVVWNCSFTMSSAAKVDIYINGEYKETISTPASSKYYNIGGIQSAKFVYAAGEQGWYIDNLTTEKLPAVPGIDTVVHTDEVTVDTETGVMSVPAGMTVDGLKSALAGNGDVKIVKQDKNEQSGVVTDGYVYVPFSENNLAGVYYPLTAAAEPEPEVGLSVVTDSAQYFQNGVNLGVVGFKTTIQNEDNLQIKSYGSFILKSGDFDSVEAPVKLYADGAPEEDGFAVEVTDIDESNFDTAVYAKSFVQTDSDVWFYSDVVSRTVNNQ